MSTKYTLEGLAEDKDEFEFMQETLNELNEMALQTSKVLKVFDLRIKNLGNVMEPINKSTKKLTVLYDNVDDTIVSLDNILKYYDVGGEDSGIITTGCNENDLDPYLEAIGRLKLAKDELSKLRLESAIQSKKEIENLIGIGLDNLRKVFYQWIKKSSKKVDPTGYRRADEIPTITSERCKELRNLAEQFCDEGNEIYLAKLADTYAEIRGRHLSECLSGLDVMCKEFYKLDIKEADRAAGRGAMGVSGTVNVNPLTQFVIPECEERQAGTADVFLMYTENLLKMLQSEQLKCREIIPAAVSERAFEKVFEPAYLAYTGTTQRICKVLLTDLYANLLRAIDVQSALKRGYPGLDRLLRFKKKGLNEIPRMLEQLFLPINGAFSGLIRTLRSPSNKPPVSKEGGIYRPAVISLDLIKNMVEYKSNISEMMFQLGDGHWNETAQEQAASGRAANPNDGTSIFCHYIEDYLSGVGQMVEATSKQFIQPVSMFAFQANNYHYIVKSIRYSTGLSSMLSDKVIAKYEANTLRNRKALMAIWKSCLASFPAMGLGPAEKLDMFNRTFDDLCADIGAFSLPDPDLRGKLTQDTIESLIPQYSKFLEKNMDVLGSGGFRLKYSVSDIEKIIDVIFSSRK